MNQTNEKIVFQGSGNLGKQSGCLPYTLIILIIIMWIGIVFDIPIITNTLKKIESESVAFIFIVSIILFPKRIMKFLFFSNRTNIDIDIIVAETQPDGFFVLIKNKENAITKYEYPFEFTYFRSVAVKTSTGQLYALNLLLFKDNVVLRFTNNVTTSEECPIGWETSNRNLSNDTFADTKQVVEITNVIKELAKKYEHLKPAKETNNISPTDEMISIFHFQFNSDENTNALLETKEGKKVVGVIREYYYEKRKIDVDSTFFEELGISNEQFYMMLSKIELNFGISFPTHLLSEINTVGYLIQLVRHLKAVYD
jgi:acyl carrier protein